ncbi:hypothetical protein [Cupriavidus numazuensis]|uniref:Uncharacterized protein n=1 Tax=Cupriavidus numazuensis TaxID=221992 RepID=A0ABN7PVF0_9BURK|nr:hypothetical protein [Cupriavidus numazuensis]CAG2132223.1 hypothetical protein LMG26411_00578 [Cupriavidus numazuensis]
MEAPEIEVLDPIQTQPAAGLVLYDAIESGLAELRAAGAEAFDVKTTAGNKAAREFIQRCVATRTATDEAYTNWNRPILAQQKLVREKRDEILASVKAIETPVKEQVDAEQKRKDEERIAKARAESARISAHQACLNAIAMLPRDYLSASVADVEAAIRDLESPEYVGQRDWEEYAEQAKEAVAAALITLRAHLENAKAREELAAMRAQQEAEAAARRAEEAKAEAERKRVAGIKDRIHAIETAPSTCIGLGVKQIQQRIESLAAEAADDFAEFQAEAGAAIEAALGNLNTMLAGARDAAELAQLRADKEARERADREAAERKVREEQEAKAAAERAEREAEAKRQAEARAAEEKRQREEAEARRREQEAAKAAAERVRAQAETLLVLLVEARAHVPAGDLADRIDAAINAATGAAE